MATTTPKMTIGPTPPAGPVPGDLWWNDVSGFLFIWYFDSNTYQWVIANPGRGHPTGPAGGDLAGLYPNPTIKPSVALTGDPTATTRPPGDHDTSIATTEFVQEAIAAATTPFPPPTVDAIVDTLAALKALATRPPYVVTRGYFAVGDGGGGPPWVWMANSTATPDDFMTVQVGADSIGRYVRLLQAGASVSPLWAGCGLSAVPFTGEINGTTLTTNGPVNLQVGSVVKGPEPILFNGSISGTVLTTLGAIALPIGRLLVGPPNLVNASPGNVILGPAVIPGTTIVSTLVGDTTGTKYTISNNHTTPVPQIALLAQVVAPNTNISAVLGPTQYTVSNSHATPAAAGATFIANSAGTTSITVSVVTGFINLGDPLIGVGLSFTPTFFRSQTSGTPGGAGVYVANHTSTLTNAPFQTMPPMTAYVDDSPQFQKVVNAGHAVDASGATYAVKGVSVISGQACPGIYSDGSAIFISGPPPVSGVYPTGQFTISRTDAFYFRNLKFINTISVDPQVAPVGTCDRPIWMSPIAGSTVPGTDWEVSGCKIVGGGNAIVFGGTVINGQIHHNVVTGTWTGGISAGYSGVGLFITDNYLYDGGFCNTAVMPAGAIRSGSWPNTPTADMVSICRNHIARYCVPAGQSIIDCFTGSARLYNVSDNVAEDCGGSIEMKTGDSPIDPDNVYRNFSCCNNTIRLPGTASAYGYTTTAITVFYVSSPANTPFAAASRAGNFKISGNHISSPVVPQNRLAIVGIGVSGFDGMSISDNFLYQLNVGIIFAGSNLNNNGAGPSYDYYISGNTIDVTETGLQLNGFTINRLYIVNNPLVKGGITGVSLANGTANNFFVKGNHIVGASTTGLEFRDCHNGVIIDNDIVGGENAILTQGTPPSNVIIESNRLKVFTDANNIPAVNVVVTSPGSGLTNGVRTFTVTNGTLGTSPTAKPSVFSFTVVGGAITGPMSLLQPGSYSVFPTVPVVTVDQGIVGGAAFTLTPAVQSYAVYPSAALETGIVVQKNIVDVTTLSTLLPSAIGTVASDNMRGTITADPNGVYAGSQGDVFYNGNLTTAINEKWLCTATGSTATAVWKSVGGAATPRLITTGATIAAPYQMLLNDSEAVVNKTVGAATGITLPALAPFGVTARVSDGKGDAGTNNITVSAASAGTINGATGGLVMNVNWETTLFRSLGGNAWSVL